MAINLLWNKQNWIERSREKTGGGQGQRACEIDWERSNNNEARWQQKVGDRERERNKGLQKKTEWERQVWTKTRGLKSGGNGDREMTKTVKLYQSEKQKVGSGHSEKRVSQRETERHSLRWTDRGRMKDKKTARETFREKGRVRETERHCLRWTDRDGMKVRKTVRETFRESEQERELN